MTTRTTSRRMVRMVLTAVVTTGVAVALSAPAGAQTAPASGWVRFAHFAPSEGPVDVRVDGDLTEEDVSFRDVTDYHQLPAGAHRVEVVTADSGAVLLDVSTGVDAGAAATVAAVGALEGVAAQVYDDDLVTPPAGEALVRFIHASPEVASVDIGLLGGADLALDVAYPAATDYVPVPGGRYDVTVTDAATGTGIVEVDGWVATAGTQATVVVLRGADGRADVVPVRDAGGAVEMPVGGVATGFGGLARSAQDPASPLAPLLVVMAGLTAVTVAAAWTSRRRWPRVAPVVLGAVLLGGACSGGGTRPDAADQGPSSTEAPSRPAAAATPSAPADDVPVRSGADVNPTVEVSAPVAISIPSVGIESELIDLGIAADGSSEVPADPDVAGWFTGGPRPGAAGPAAILGHVDSRTGPAVFARLHELVPGAIVEVLTADGSVSFAVERTEQVAKDAFPTEAVFGPTPDHALRLITCGGTFDDSTGHYRDNVVVFLTERAP